jgi:cell division protein FtsB
MKSAVLRVSSVAAFLLGCFYVFFALRAPQGYAALREKRVQIRQLERQNADLAKENQLKREKIRKLLDDRQEQDRVIREHTRKLKPGETQFIIQDSK